MHPSLPQALLSGPGTCHGQVEDAYDARTQCTFEYHRLPLNVIRHEAPLPVGWSRKGFRLFWTWKSRRRGIGRRAAAKGGRNLIRKISHGNPLWGAPRVRGVRRATKY